MKVWLLWYAGEALEARAFATLEAAKRQAQREDVFNELHWEDSGHEGWIGAYDEDREFCDVYIRPLEVQP